MDIRNIATADSANEAQWMHVIDLSGQKSYSLNDDGENDKSKPARIKLLGKDSKNYRHLLKVKSNEYLASAQRRHGKKRNTLKIEDIEDDDLELTIIATVEFENLELDGRVLDANNTEDVKMLYELSPDVFDQAKEFIEDRENFTSSYLKA